METTRLISELLAIAIVVLMAVAIACPVAALIVQDAGERVDRLRGGLARRGSGTARRARQARAARARSRPIQAAVHPNPEWGGRRTLAPAAARDRREQKRFKTCFLGTLHRANGAEPENLCDILDISVGGARVRPVDPMPARRRITLGLRNFGHFPARVVWRRGDELGLKFEQAPNEIMAVMQGLLPRSAFPEMRAAHAGPMH